MFILDYISDGRLIKIDGTNGQYVPLNRQELADQYDIMVDDAPTSANMKEQTFQTISGLLPMALQAGIPIPPEVLEYSPLPAALVSKWMNLIEEQKKSSQDPEKSQMQQTIQQMSEELKVAVNELSDKHEQNALKAKSDELKFQTDSRNAEIAEKDLLIESYKAETDRLKAEADAKLRAVELAKPADIPLPDVPVETEPNIPYSQEESMPITEDMLVAKLNEVRSVKQREQAKEDEERAYREALLNGIAGVQSMIGELTQAVARPREAIYDANGQIQGIQ